MTSLKRILRSKKLSDIKLLNNIDASDNLVRSVTVIDSYSFVNYLKGGEIVITSLYTIEDNIDIQKSFVKLLKESRCVALIIKTTKKLQNLSQELLDYAEELGFPIYKAPATALGYSDILSEINELIITTKRRDNIKKEYINNILYSDIFDERTLEKWGKDLGCKAVSSYTGAIYIYIVELVKNTDDKFMAERSNIKYMFENHLTKILDKIYSIRSKNRIGMMAHYDGFSVFPAQETAEEVIDKLDKMQKAILKMCNEQFPKLTIHIGISDVSNGIGGIRIGFKQAEFAMKIGRTLNTNKSIYYYKDYEIYDLFYKLHSKNDLDFSKNVLGQLYENDILLETLWTYFKNDENMQDTSKELNIHPNTLKYRLNKIRETTNLDERKIGDKFKFFLATLEYYMWKI